MFLFLAGLGGQDMAWIASSDSSSPSRPSKVVRLVTLFTHFFHIDDSEEPEAVDADVECVLTGLTDGSGRWP
jgi:hypothetical protein